MPQLTQIKEQLKALSSRSESIIAEQAKHVIDKLTELEKDTLSPEEVASFIGTLTKWHKAAADNVAFGGLLMEALSAVVDLKPTQGTPVDDVKPKTPFSDQKSPRQTQGFFAQPQPPIEKAPATPEMQIIAELTGDVIQDTCELQAIGRGSAQSAYLILTTPDLYKRLFNPDLDPEARAILKLQFAIRHTNVAELILTTPDLLEELQVLNKPEDRGEIFKQIVNAHPTSEKIKTLCQPFISQQVTTVGEIITQLPGNDKLDNLMLGKRALSDAKLARSVLKMPKLYDKLSSTNLHHLALQDDECAALIFATPELKACMLRQTQGDGEYYASAYSLLGGALPTFELDNPLIGLTRLVVAEIESTEVLSPSNSFDQNALSAAKTVLALFDQAEDASDTMSMR